MVLGVGNRFVCNDMLPTWNLAYFFKWKGGERVEYPSEFSQPITVPISADTF